MPIPFSIPASSAIDPETGLLPSEDWHDVTLSAREPKMSKSGKFPMMSAEFTIDNGKFCGAKLAHTFVFGLSSGDGEAFLLKFLNEDGTMGTPQERWKQLPTLEEFVGQFPAGQLRAGAKIVHIYSIQTENGYENVNKERFEEWTGKKNLKAEIADFRGAAQPSAIKRVEVNPSAGDGLPFEPANKPAPF